VDARWLTSCFKLLDEMAKAALAQGDYGIGRLTLAEAYAGKAVTLLQQGASHDEVEKYLDLSRKASRNSADYHYARGMLERADGDESDAREEFERALEIERDHREAKVALGRK
jgi:tetratricopeptide (TPR) repeat protein